MRQRLWLGWGRGTHCFLWSPVIRSAKTQSHLVKVLWNLKASVIKTQKSSFFPFLHICFEISSLFYQHISMTCSCRSSTRTCSTEVSLYRLKKSRDSIDFRSALSLSLLFWRTASNQDRSLIYLWHMVLGQQRHLALATFEGRVDLTHYKKPPPSHSNNSLSAICKE